MTRSRTLTRWQRARWVLATVFLMGSTPVSAAGLAPRNVQVGSSGPGVTTSYVINATTATSDLVGSISFEFCVDAVGSCVLPSGVVTTGATLGTQSGATGFTLMAGANGRPYLTRVAASVNDNEPLSYTLNNITNPTATNTSYFVRITTYTASDGVTGPVDNGTVALSTAEPVQLTGVTPEILVFCVGTTIVGNCTTIAGDTIDFGDFSPTSTRTGTSVMQAQTNAAGGYVITVNGSTLASGINTIPALATQTTSIIGTSQFGMNLRANGTPVVGTNPTGVGIGGVVANYNTPNLWRYGSGEAVASAPAPTNENTYTSSYIVNIGGAQAAGVYTATMTYICTASF